MKNEIAVIAIVVAIIVGAGIGYLGGTINLATITITAMAPTDKISLTSGVELCSNNCVYPSPFLSALVLVNASSPLSTLHLFVNGTDEGVVASFDNLYNTVYTYLLKANPLNASMPIQADKTYSVELVATFRDGETSTATASVVAGSGSG